MIQFVSKWWEKNGFALLVISSILFIFVCWVMGWKPKKGRAGNIRDYIKDIFDENSGVSSNDEVKKTRNPKKSEEKCREIVENIFQQPFPSMRPDFLRNPETGRNLECDLMNKDLKICIERNGEQHYKHVSHFHTKHEFSKQLERDKLKKRLLDENGYTLFTIPYTVHYDSLHEYIPELLSKHPKYRPYVEKYLRKY